MVVTVNLGSPTYRTPYRPFAWDVGHGFIPVCVEFSHEMQTVRGAVIWVADAIGESRSVHRIIPRGVQPGIVDMMSIIHSGERSLLTQRDILAVVELLNVHVMAKI